jgi:DNA-binding LytR/AlgR family response regulator
MNLTAQAAIRAVLVDDEPTARNILREEFESIPDVEIVGEAENGVEAIEQIHSLKPDLVLLDLEMPEVDGFEVVARLDASNLPCIVVITSYDQHALRAFEVGAVDYLLKPVAEGRLAQSIERVRRLRSFGTQAAEGANSALEPLRIDSTFRPRKIVGKIGEEYFLIESSQIRAFQAEYELVWIITRKQRYLAAQSLRVIEQKVAGLNFMRVHRKSLVNLDHVTKMSPLSSQRWLLTLDNHQEFVVSKRQARSIQSFFW